MSSRRRVAVGASAVVFAAVVVMVIAAAAVLGYGLASSASPSTEAGGSSVSSAQSGEAFFVQVVNGSSASPLAGVSVEAGPIASPNDVVFTPGGPLIDDCVHQVPNGYTVSGDEAVSGSSTVTFSSCSETGYTTDAAGRVSMAGVTGPFFFIRAGSVNQWNYVVVGVQPGTTLNMTIPLPSGNITVPSTGETCTGGTGSNFTSSCSPSPGTPVLSPPTRGVVPCGTGLPNGSTVVPEGSYAGVYVAYPYAVLSNGTQTALSPDCGATIGQIGAGGSGSALVTVSGTIAVSNGSGQGTLVVAVKNDADGPISSITVGVAAGDGATYSTSSGAYQSGVVASSGDQTYTAGGPPFTLFSGDLAVGQATSGVAQLSGVASGQTYSFAVTIAFTTGETQVQTLSITAQS